MEHRIPIGSTVEVRKGGIPQGLALVTGHARLGAYRVQEQKSMTFFTAYENEVEEVAQ